ncbi:hypothetical protein OF83DRAFT_262051 [Amylostereum chailletii]|nr:hypothetical protein OF83DRAFT_262051 [Amylostereum chailletii]
MLPAVVVLASSQPREEDEQTHVFECSQAFQRRKYVRIRAAEHSVDFIARWRATGKGGPKTAIPTLVFQLSSPWASTAQRPYDPPLLAHDQLSEYGDIAKRRTHTDPYPKIAVHNTHVQGPRSALHHQISPYTSTPSNPAPSHPPYTGPNPDRPGNLVPPRSSEHMRLRTPIDILSHSEFSRRPSSTLAHYLR